MLVARQTVLVQFWAVWSEVCRVMRPLLDSVSKGKFLPVKVGTVNVEDNETLADLYGVRAVPTLLIFNRGGLQDRIIGFASQQELCGKLERFR